jgi:hypothetical protein
MPLIRPLAPSQASRPLAEGVQRPSTRRTYAPGPHTRHSRRREVGRVCRRPLAAAPLYLSGWERRFSANGGHHCWRRIPRRRKTWMAAAGVAHPGTEDGALRNRWSSGWSDRRPSAVGCDRGLGDVGRCDRRVAVTFSGRPTARPSRDCAGVPEALRRGRAALLPNCPPPAEVPIIGAQGSAMPLIRPDPSPSVPGSSVAPDGWPARAAGA